MSDKTNIEWCDSTWNPWEGCQKVGPGCDHCYAETRNARFAGGTAINWGPGAPRRRTSIANWRKPLAWNMQNFVQCEDCGHRGAGVPWRDLGLNLGVIDDGHQCEKCASRSVEPTRARVFCASLADVFDNSVDPQWRADLFALIEATPNLDWLLLTKRIGNVRDMVPLPWISKPFQHGPNPTNIYPAGWPENAWLGATICNQEEADRDIPKLLAVPAARRFLSMEPLLGPVDLRRLPTDTCASECCGMQRLDCLTGREICDMSEESYDDGPRVDWVIVGGESGPGARPMSIQWARELRDQCAAAGVPFLFKQWGEWTPGVNVDRHTGVVDTAKWFDRQWMFGREDLSSFGGHVDDEPDLYRVGKKAAGRLLDGVQHDGYPAAA